MPRIDSRPLSYAHGTTRMSGQLFYAAAASGARPGVLVVPGASGLGRHPIRSAERLAGSGRVALAMDLWGDRAQIDDVSEALSAIEALTADPRSWMGRVEAACRTLAEQPEVEASKLAAIGYCFGGATVLEYARTGGEILGVAAFHAGLDEVGREWSSERTRAKLLVCTGVDDPMVPGSALVDFQGDLSGSGVDWEIDTYSGTRHAFTNPEIDAERMPGALAYNEQSDRRSWERLGALLDEVFSGGWPPG